jgi:hypothetical protein
MRLKELDRLELPASADMHVHLRQGAMMELVVPQIKAGGVDTVFVMVREERETSLISLRSYNLLDTAQSPATYYDCCPGS